MFNFVFLEHFASLRELYLRNGQGFVLVYSIISQASFKDVYNFYDQIVRVKNPNETFIVLVGNKCDLDDQRVISKDQGQALAIEFNCSFIESSAKLNYNIADVNLSLHKISL